MNAGRYRLIFDHLRGVLVPCSEATRRRGARAGMRASVGRTGGAASLALVAIAGSDVALAQGLPVPRANNFVTSGSATAVENAARSAMTINQTTNRAILNWSSFNIGAGNSVRFNQPNASSIALNRIGGGTPSIIAGQLSANGQIYLINQNGILFTRGAQVNVAGIVASSLDIGDDVFNQGILSTPRGSAQFQWNGTESEFGNSLVRLEPGAVITTGEGGRVMMFAPRVENAGRIEAPGGQVILAAGLKVYLEASSDVNLRGLLVEVDPLATGAGPQGGTVTNQKLGEAVGEIITRRGNTTLAALAVNQEGRISATTTVSANGSIYLIARDTTSVATPGATAIGTATRSGTVTLGKGSTTEVLPESGDKSTSIDVSTFNPSQVKIDGKKIHVQERAKIVAPGGEVNLTARDLSQGSAGESSANASRIFIDKNAVIDVAGSRDVEVAVERNIVSAELRGNELRDAPLQRNGILRGRTVKVDVRKGTTLADVSGYTAQVGRTVGERTAAGGSINLQSQGDVVLREGSLLDVSGGSLKYLRGVTSTTKLLTNGKIVDISQASPNQVYQAVFEGKGVTEAGYIEGKSAGSVTVVARAIALDGSMRGNVVAGPNQRDVATAPKGGRLVLGDSTGGGQNDFRTPAVVFDGVKPPLPQSFLDDPLEGALGERASEVHVAVDAFAGFNRFAAFSNESVTVDSALHLAAGGEFSATARRVTINQDIVIPGGSIVVTSVPAGGLAVPGVVLAGGRTLSTAGIWTNDADTSSRRGALAGYAINGGSIALRSRVGIDVGPGALLDVSGAARVTSAGTVSNGTAGSIELTTNIGRDAAGALDPLVFPTIGGGSLRAYAPGKGGSVSITVNRARIGGTATGDEFVFAPDLFRQGGFASYRINGIQGMTISENTQIAPSTSSFFIVPGFLDKPTGTALQSFARIEPLLEGLRNPANLTLSASFADADLVMERGASITTDIGGTVALSAGNQLAVRGAITAPAGRIDLAITSSAESRGFLANQALWIGADATLDVSGRTKSTTNTLGQRIGSVLTGGQINLTTTRGYVVVEEGARFDVRGTSGTLDVLTDVGAARVLRPQLLHSDAGGMRIDAREGVLFDGTVQAGAVSASAAGGRFELVLDRKQASEGSFLYPTGDRRIELIAAGNALPGGLAPGQDIDTAAYNGRAIINVARLNTAGFDDVRLVSESRIQFTGAGAAGDVLLSARRAITLDSPVLGAVDAARARIEAAYVLLGNTNGVYQSPRSGSAGDGALSVRAGLIDLAGAYAMENFGAVTLHSDTDIRLRGVLANSVTADRLIGSLRGAGTLELAAEQAYPTTLSEYLIDYGALAASKVTITQVGASGATPLSAGGSLTIRAQEIVQDGTLRAPLGSISLQAAKFDPLAADGAGTLRLTTRSVTSVAATNGTGAPITIPFGKVENAKDWLYDFRNNVSRLFTAPPAKRIELRGETVEMAAGAKVDAAGGGDLYAYEFVPGLGGSLDYLAQPNTYAILPGYTRGYAPFDYQYSTISDLKVGDSVTLTELARGSGDIKDGLPAGTYTLLPGHYALLPGAFAVRVLPNSQDRLASQNVMQPDGSVIVAGTRGVGMTGTQAARSQAFVVETSAAVRKRAEYGDFGANRFFPAQAQRNGVPVPRLPIDAGQLIAAATTSLTLDGSIGLGAARGGRGGLLDIDAENIVLVGPHSASRAGFLPVSAAELSSIGADSILIGGSRTTGANGQQLVIGATRVIADNGKVGGAGDDEAAVATYNAQNKLAAGEIILAATDAVSINGGAVVQATGTAALYAASDRIAVTGDGGVVRVSSDRQSRLLRTGVTQASGSIDIGSKAALIGNAVELDATVGGSAPVTLASDFTLSTTTLALAAGRISFGNPVAASGESAVGGIIVGPDLLRQLEALETLQLRGYQDIGFGAGASLGGRDANATATLRQLTLDTPALRNAGAVGDVELLAGNVILRNTTGVAATPVSGTQTLRIRAETTATSAGTITLDRGDKAIDGFSRVELIAAGTVRAVDQGTLTAAGAVDMTSAGLVGTSGAEQSLRLLGGALTVNGNGVEAPAEGIGVKWSLSAGSITFAGRAALPSGSISLRADGGDLTVLAGARLLAGGFRQTFDGVPAYGAGGRVELIASGNIAVGQDALIDVFAHRDCGDAGSAVLHAGGRIDLAGQFRRADDTAADDVKRHNARIDIDAGTLGDAHAIWTQIGAGRFGEAIGLRTRAGDLAIGAGDVLHSRRILLSADGGRVLVDGTLDASGAKPGEIRIHGGQGAAIAATAVLSAGTTGQGVDGGAITIDAGAGRLDVAGGSFDVSGGTGARGGTVTLRALRTGAGAGSDVAIDGFAANVTGARTVSVEAVKTYDNVSELSSSGSGSVLGLDAVIADNDAFVANAAAILTRLGKANDPAFLLQPGVEVRGPGDVAVTSAWDLSTARHGGQPGALTVRAAGNLTLSADLSDGFSGAALMAGESWSYRLVAGADLAASNPLAVMARDDSGKDLVVGSAVRVRTGTGSIEVAAQRDIRLTDNTAVLYTAGSRVADDPAFQIWDPATVAFAEHGGRLRIDAGRDIVGAAGAQLINNWFYHVGSVDVVPGQSPTFKSGGGSAWWISYDLFQQNVGALGGGDVELSAGRDLVDVSAMLPTTARMPGAGPSKDALQVFGGGDLRVQVGRDVRGGQFLVGKGEALFEAGGALVNGAAVNGSDALLPILAGMDARFELRTRGDNAIETMFNPTALPQTGTLIGENVDYRSYFFTYEADSSLRMNSLVGDVRIDGRSSAIANLAQSSAQPEERLAFNSLTGSINALTVAPGSLHATAFGGSVAIPNTVTLHASRVGQVELLARQDVVVAGSLRMLDIDDALLGTPFAPFGASTQLADLVTALPTSRLAHAPIVGDDGRLVPLHAVDGRIARIAADRDIIGGNTFSGVFAKPARLAAGRDIFDFDLYAQNLKAGDVTQLVAGRDIRYEVARLQGTNQLTPNQKHVAVAGPGAVEVIAGRDIDLGTSIGIVTHGNLANPALPDRGADILTYAGAQVGLDPAKFLTDFRKVDIFTRKQDRLEFTAVLGEAMRAFTGNTGLGDADALNAFQALDGAAQTRVAAAVANTAFFAAYLAERPGLIQSYPSTWWDFQAAKITNGDRALEAKLLTAMGASNLAAARTAFLSLSGTEQRERALQISDLADLRAFRLSLHDHPPGGEAIVVPKSYREEWLLYTTARGVDANALDAATIAGFSKFVLWPELRAAGRQAVGAITPNDYSRGYDAIALAQMGGGFTANGNISLIFSQIKTERGGSIEMLVPGGGVNVGLATPPGGFRKGPDELGIISVKGGDVNALVRNDFQVNQSRVFTLEGGNILLWSSAGNIDAGRGAKTAISVPPPVLRVDDQGNLVVEFPGAATGSGIGVLLTNPSVVPGDVDLIAPVGAVDAGDAGVRAAGNLIVAARIVLNAANFQGCTQVGVPPLSSAGSIASPASSTAATRSAERATQDSTAASDSKQDNFIPSFLTVEAIGLGEDDSEERRRLRGQ